jgi:hypothetical protein
VNEGVNNPPMGQSSLLGENFTPVGQLLLLKTGLWSSTYCVQKVAFRLGHDK